MDVSKQQKPILEAAMTAPGAFKTKYIVEKSGLAYNIVSPQLDRLVAKKILVKDKEARTYTVSEEARKEWAKPEKPPAATIATPNTEQTEHVTEHDEHDEEKEEAEISETKKKAPSEESLGLSPYQHFKSLGIKIGLAANLVDVVADHIFNGGKYTDIKWVYRGLSEMAIRDDVRTRWAGAWSSYLQKAMPTEYVEQIKQQAEQAEIEIKASESGGKGTETKDFIVEDGQVEYIGPGLGAFTFNQAMQISVINSRRKPAADAQAPVQKAMTPTELLDFFTKLQAVQKTSGGNADQVVPSSFVVTMNPDGTSEIKEYKSSGPIVIEKPQPAAQVRSFMLAPDGSVQELEPGKPTVFQRQPAQQPEIWVLGPDGQLIKSEAGQPIVLKQPAPVDQGSKVMLINQTTGELIEWDPKKPIVITRQEPKSDSPMSIQVVDKDGNPMRMDLNALITWKRFEGEEKRSDERAKTLKDLVGTVREQFPTLVQALGAAFAGKGAPAGAGQPATKPGATQGPTNTAHCNACGANISLNPSVPAPDTFECPSCGAAVATRPEATRG